MEAFARRRQLTNLAEATSTELQSNGCSVISDYDIFHAMERVYGQGRTKYLRGVVPTLNMLEATKSALNSANVISRDKDYRRFWRLNIVPEGDVGQIVTHVDPAVYVSHISAMVIYNLTTRRPKPLFLTKATGAAWLNIRDDVQQRKYYPVYESRSLANVHHPKKVRGRQLNVLSSRKYGVHLQTRNSRTRVSTIGQTFLDMLEKPTLCGGMSHVLEVFEEYCEDFLPEIIKAVNDSGSPISKVRAGYILNERLAFHNEKIESWKQFAQRGSSRILDPERPFEPAYSEEWMLSINA
ncbi:hypothetical protein [Erythrobacter sp. MTPC3]|uniref:hypothetical protein n=1 Tax=Erythrobacter sp. MTPC3 TaxID=3056564 RepID=UPI0036F1A9C7